MIDQSDAHVFERRNTVMCLCEMHWHLASNIIVSDGESVLRILVASGLVVFPM